MQSCIHTEPDYVDLYTSLSGDMDAPIAARTAWSWVRDGWWLLDVMNIYFQVCFRRNAELRHFMLLSTSQFKKLGVC